MLPIKLPADTVDALFKEVAAQDGYQLAIDLEAETVTRPDGSAIAFELDPFLKKRLLNGWDQIGLTLRHEDRIAAFEAAQG